MPTVRNKLLRKAHGRPHRYQLYRLGTQSGTLGILYYVPLSGLARCDLWGGEHWSLFERVGFAHGFVAVCVGVTLLYVITFLANFFCGRLFCGWGCPVAQVSRFGEAVERDGWRALIQGSGFVTLLVVGVMFWWTSPRVFTEGSWTARAVFAGIFAALFSLTYLEARFVRWQFCRKACPVGLYYSVVATETSHGIVFEEELSTCKECDLCDRICPVDLHPRELERPQSGNGGLSIDGLPEDNHCLRCGDCVTACEHVFAREGRDSVPLHFGFGRKGVPLEPRRPDAAQQQDTASIPDHEEPLTSEV